MFCFDNIAKIIIGKTSPSILFPRPQMVLAVAEAS
jgi:hypothetical protein